MRVVIIGAGIFGCCAAYALARAGAHALLIERDPIGAHASSRNPGNLNPVLGSVPALVPFALESFRLHQELAAAIGPGTPPYALEPVKRVLVAFDDEDEAELDSVARAFAGLPSFATSRLSAASVRAIEPRLTPGIRCALLIEGNYSFDSAAFHLAISAAARDAGADLVQASATGIATRGEAVTHVDTVAGRHRCDALVLATGPWVAETREWLGLHLPVAPVKGEMLRLRLRGRALSHDFTHGLISLYRRGEEEVWLGVTREEVGFDESPSEAGRRALLDGAARILPEIRDADVIEHLAALRPLTRSALPIVGRAPGWNNVYVANGGGIKGMLLSAGVGVAIRDLILSGTTTLPLPADVGQGVG